LDVIETIETLIDRGVTVVVLGLGELDGSPTSRLTLTMLAAISQFERELIGERTKEALAIKKANGVQLG
jgi:putative DNA-invertase from lambdoid prophage Rac